MKKLFTPHKGERSSWFRFLFLGAVLLFSTSQVFAQLSGTVTVGPGGTYTTLTTTGTGLFAALNTSGTSGALTVNIIGTAITEPGNVQLNLTGTAHAITIQRQPGLQTQCVITCNNTANGTVRIGRPNVTIDGKVVGIGHGSSDRKLLSFRGGGTNPVLGIAANAQNLTIKNLDIQSGGNNGVALHFGNGTVATGIDNVTIENCTLHPGGTNRMNNMMALVNNAGGLSDPERHDNFVFRNNGVYNFGQLGGASTNLTLQRFNNTLVEKNSFYQTNTIVPTGNRTWTIVNNQSASGRLVMKDNFIGGSDSACVGTWIAGGTGGFVRLIPIRAETPATADTNLFVNNLLTNISTNTNFSGNCNEQLFTFYIGTSSGNKTNAKINNNRFGSNGTIVIKRTSTNTTRTQIETDFCRIYGGNDVQFNNNIVENLSYELEATTGNGANMYSSLVNFQAPDGFSSAITGTIDIRNNTFRAVTTSVTGGGSGVNNFRAINLQFGGAGNTGNINVLNNKITDINLGNANLSYSHGDVTCSSIGFSGLHRSILEGIAVGVLTTEGVRVNSTTGFIRVGNNTIANLRSSTPGMPINGIALRGFGSNAGNVEVFNNAVSLGSGATSTNDAAYSALLVDALVAGGAANYYINNNSFVVGGTSTGSQNTAAVNITANAASTFLRNNIIQNTRSGGTGKHYAYIAEGVSVNTNFNAVHSASFIGTAAGNDYANLAAWQGAGYDVLGTQDVLVTFNDAANGNLAVTNCNPVAGMTTTLSAPYFVITTDITGAAHTAPYSPGAYKISAGGGSTYLWLGTSSSNWNDAANWCGGGGGAPTATSDVVINDAEARPFWPVLNSNIAANSINISGTTTQFTVNTGFSVTLTGDYIFSGTIANQLTTGSTFVLNGSSPQTISNLRCNILNVSGANKNLTGTVSVGGALILGSANVTVGANSTFTVAGNVSFTTGAVRGSATGNIIFNSGSSNLLPLAANDVFQDITINNLNGGGMQATGGTLNVRNLTINAGLFNAGSTTINISGSLTRTAGSIVPGTSTFNFNGAGTQSITGTAAFNNLSITKVVTSTVNFNGNISVAGTFTVQQDNGGATVTVNLGNSTLTLNGPVVSAGPGIKTLTATTATSIALTGTGVWPWSVITGSAPSQITNLTLITTGSAGAVAGNLTVTGNAVFTNGSLSFGPNALFLNGPVSGAAGVAEFGSLGMLTIGGTGSINYLPLSSGQTLFSVTVTRPTFNVTHGLNFTVNSLEMIAGSKLTHNANITFSGSFAGGKLGDGEYINNNTATFSGTVSQNVVGTNTFNNMTFSNSGSGTTVSSGATNVYGLVTMSTNGRLAISSGTFTLRNDGTRQGSIGIMGNNSQITGQVGTEMFVPSGTPGWYFMGSPVKGATISSLQPQMNFRGVPGAPGFWGNGNPSIYFHRESQLASNGWYPAATYGANVGRGMRIWLDDNFFSVNRNSRFVLRGQPIVGDSANQTFTTGEAFTFGLTRTAGPNIGFNMVTNPYASNLLLDNSANWTTTNVSNVIHFWNAVARTYQTVDRSSATRVIPMGQAFFVEATAASPVFQVRETAKTTTAASLGRTGASFPELQLMVSKNNSQLADWAQIQFRPETQEAYEADADGHNLYGGAMDIYTISSAHQLTHNVMDLPTSANRIIGIGYNTQDNAGTMLKLTITGVNSISGDHNLVLVDNYTGTTTSVVDGMMVDFMHTGNPGVAIDDRFALIVQPRTITNLNGGNSFTATMRVVPNPASRGNVMQLQLAGLNQVNSTLTIVDAAGRLVSQEVVTSGKLLHELNAPLAAGVYTVRLVNGTNVLTQKLVVE